VAERLETYHFGPGPQPTYDWANWTDGGIWRLKRGEDFALTIKSFREYVYSYAKTHRLSVLTRVEDDCLVVQFTPR
jgi:hypothetical protein